MKHLINHLLTANREQILKRSLMHCHAENVHSIMLLESPGKTIRMFIAEPGHKLAYNCPRFVNDHQSVPFHAHHCEIALETIFGRVTNWLIAKDPNGALCIPQYVHKSKITTGAIGFKRSSRRRFRHVAEIVSMPGDGLYLRAEDIHTVAVPENSWAAWMVYEGREDTSHDSRAWSYANISKQEFGSLYKPMSESAMVNLLESVDAL